MKKIAKIVKKADSVAIVIHVNPDSDCVGSAVALLLTLRKMGKKADIFCDSDIPSRLSFLVQDDYFEKEVKKYDVCLAVDVAEDYMMGAYKDTLFAQCPVTLCLDHHATNSGYADYNYVDSKAAAAGEIVYEFIKKHLKQTIETSVAAPLYSAIASDTGSFRYSNTTSRTHKIASELIDKGINAPYIMSNLFERKTAGQLMLNAEVTSKLKFYENGRICVAVVDEAMLSKYEISFGEADDIAAIPRSVVGVEVGVYIKVKGENDCKVSLRSNDYVDVSAIAKQLGGGGHIRAAGVTINDTAENTEKIILDTIKKVI